MTNVNEKQVAGSHYKGTQFQPWDVILDWKLGYLEGTALKYIARWKKKNGVEDIKKAIHFLEKLVHEEEQVQRSLQQVVNLSQKDFIPTYKTTNHFYELEEVQRQWVADREAQDELLSRLDRA